MLSFVLLKPRSPLWADTKRAPFRLTLTEHQNSPVKTVPCSLQEFQGFHHISTLQHRTL